MQCGNILDYKAARSLACGSSLPPFRWETQEGGRKLPHSEGLPWNALALGVDLGVALVGKFYQSLVAQHCQAEQGGKDR
jgi:hypothetical protein